MKPVKKRRKELDSLCPCNLSTFLYIQHWDFHNHLLTFFFLAWRWIFMTSFKIIEWVKHYYAVLWHLCLCLMETYQRQSAGCDETVSCEHTTGRKAGCLSAFLCFTEHISWGALRHGLLKDGKGSFILFNPRKSCLWRLQTVTHGA